MKIFFSELATQELEDATEYYELEQSGRGSLALIRAIALRQGALRRIPARKGMIPKPQHHVQAFGEEVIK